MQASVPSASEARVARTAIDDTQIITTKQLREILGGCSEMHIWRLLNDPSYRALKFPRPIPINRRNYFRLQEVRRWIGERARESQAARSTPPSRGGLRAPRAASACATKRNVSSLERIDTFKGKSVPSREWLVEEYFPATTAGLTGKRCVSKECVANHD
jgi:predicted DNA-binding transcriptional regulator AlpA